MKNLILTFVAVLFISAGAFAQDQTRRADVRQKAQRVRIADGRKDGEITRQEGAALNAQQRHIRRAERRAKADGTVTMSEKRRLERKQDRASRNIRRAKHNDIKRDGDN
mgnify:CR=1 FL=1